MLISVKCTGKPDNRENSKKVYAVLEQIHFFEVLENWLQKHFLNYVSLKAIKCVLVSTEILGEGLVKYNGFAQKVRDVYYIYVEHGMSVERTVSILVHEIAHIELENIFREYEENCRTQVEKELEEETVIFLGHYILDKMFGIRRYDISLEEHNWYLNEFCLDINENNIVESLYRWLEKRQKSKMEEKT